MSVHVFTSITLNYLPKARVLAESVKRFLPDSIFHLQLMDPPPADFDLSGECFDAVIGIDDLGLKHPQRWMFKHSVVEACTGVKGFALKKLLSRRDCSAVLYFDPDIVVLAPLNELLANFQSASVLLTPHLTQPERTPEAIEDNEFSVLRHGIYNLGFLGVKNSPEGRRFAEWWADRLEDYCYDDIPRGLFTDQRWADLVPAYFSETAILRHPGYNVCTWNLTHRPVLGDLRNGFTAAGKTLYFYHFSGFDSGAQIAMLDKYGSRMPALYELRDWYISECDRHGQQEWGRVPWTYGTFDNGAPIHPLHRQKYRQRFDLQQAFPNPFATANVGRSYYHWFEANEECAETGNFTPAPASNLKPIERGRIAAVQNTPFDPSYRIYFSVCGSAVEDAAVALRRLLEKTYRKSDVQVIAAQEMSDALQGRPDWPSGVSMVALENLASHEDAFRFAAVACGGDSDFIFVTPAVVVPELWDLRLAWTAIRVAGAGTVSPINDLCSATGLGIDHSPQSVDALDRACYQLSHFWNPEIPAFLSDCTYFNRIAMREVLESQAPVTFKSVLERLEKLRWSRVLADHIYTGVPGGSPEVREYATSEPLASLRQQLQSQAQSPAASLVVSIRERARRRQLHIMHSWGGGLEKWVTEYCNSDETHDNFILKSIGTWGYFGIELHLYRRIEDRVPLRTWSLTPSIKHTATEHPGYRAALAEIVSQYGIDAILISSLIGHSLDAVETALPTLMVCHDYYPFCPALNITFDSVCTRCTEADLERCTVSNPHHRFFRNVPPAEWMELRKQFVDRALQSHLTAIAPSPSVRKNYVQLRPELESRFQVVPHGVPSLPSPPLEPFSESKSRLRIVILGSLAPDKGLELLNGIQSSVRSFADILLLGCGDYGARFRSLPGVTVIPSYTRDELPGLLRSLRPDLGLLLSVVPETFSYTLQELMLLGIPTLATRRGSFVDFIEDGRTGFLSDPDPAALLSRLRELDANRAPLALVRENLRTRKARSLSEMHADYEALLGLPSLSSRAYFAPETGSSRRNRPARAMRVYWRSRDSRFDETASARVEIDATGTNQVVRLNIPPMPQPPAELRLKLGDHRGLLILFKAKLFASPAHCLWEWDSQASGFTGAKSDIDILGGTRGSLLYLSGEDPHWILPISGRLERLEHGGRLEIEVCYPSVESLTLNPVEQTRSGSRHDSQRMLAQQLAESRARVSALENSLSWRITTPLRRVWTVLLKNGVLPKQVL
jgi:glycosyltransferase involved in cell wall biosynthesis